MVLGNPRSMMQGDGSPSTRAAAPSRHTVAVRRGGFRAAKGVINEVGLGESAKGAPHHRAFCTNTPTTLTRPHASICVSKRCTEVDDSASCAEFFAVFGDRTRFLRGTSP